MPGKRLKAITITTYIDAELKEALQRWAAEEGRSASNLAARLITLAVREHLAKQGVPVGAQARQGGAGDE